MGDAEFLQEMGKRIVLRRKALHLTQEELAARLGVSTQMISNLELGKKAIRPENLSRVCEILQVSTDFILTGMNADQRVNCVAEKLLQLTDAQLQTVSDMIDHIIHNK